jgi:aspartate aminotransferase
MGAFYAFVSIAGILGTVHCGVTIDSSRSFADFLLAQARVRLHPGADFGSDAHVRISFATSLEDLEEGLERISSLLSRGHA